MAFENPNFTSPPSLFITANEYTGGYFGYFILMLIFAAAYFKLSHLTPKESFAGASWLTALCGIFFWWIGIVPFWFFFMFAIFSLVSVFINMFGSK